MWYSWCKFGATSRFHQFHILPCIWYISTNQPVPGVDGPPPQYNCFLEENLRCRHPRFIQNWYLRWLKLMNIKQALGVKLWGEVRHSTRISPPYTPQVSQNRPWKKIIERRSFPSGSQWNFSGKPWNSWQVSRFSTQDPQTRRRKYHVMLVTDVENRILGAWGVEAISCRKTLSARGGVSPWKHGSCHQANQREVWPHKKTELPKLPGRQASLKKRGKKTPSVFFFKLNGPSG